MDGENEKYIKLSKEHIKIDNNSKIGINDHEPAAESYVLLHGGLKLLRELKVEKTNIIENIVHNGQPLTETYLTSMKVLPRPPPYILQGMLRPDTPWDFFNSVFKEYIPDNDRLLNDCFETDWAQTKIVKFVRDEEQSDLMKKYLKKHYKAIRETYKQYSGISPLGRVMSIGPGTL